MFLSLGRISRLPNGLKIKNKMITNLTNLNLCDPFRVPTNRKYSVKHYVIHMLSTCTALCYESKYCMTNMKSLKIVAKLKFSPEICMYCTRVLKKVRHEIYHESDNAHDKGNES